MVFPIAGGATAIGYNLGTTSCPTAAGGPPTATLDFTSSEIDKIFQGSINRWNDPALVANNPQLAACVGTFPPGTTTNGATIQRVVRSDSSGTTQQYKTYLSKTDSAAVCDGVAGRTWASLAPGNNIVWPGDAPATAQCADVNSNLAVAPVRVSGTQNIVPCVEGAAGQPAGCGDGSLSYGELGIWGQLAPTATLAFLQTAASTGGTPVYIAPGSGTTGSNCDFTSLGGLPGSATGQDAVSLNGTPRGQGNNNWASDATSVGAANKSDFTFIGSNYPVCGMTWDIVYSNLHIIGGVNDPFPGLTADERAQLYAFYSYVFTPQGQGGLTGVGYDPLPQAWWSTIRGGFQQFF
jgi:ABC-type phosphate transport system substrate-binding protein